MGNPRSLCIFLLAFSLVPISGRPEDTLRTISDLQGRDFGRKFESLGLNLLYWFSSEYITFDNNDNMQPAKDPALGAFGFHHYRNHEDLLPKVPEGYTYYTVGNVFYGMSRLPRGEWLPDYVFDSHSSGSMFNAQRIIVRRTPYGSIDQVYITQHYDINLMMGSRYNERNTYGISRELIRTIRNLTRDNFLQQFLPRTTNNNNNNNPFCHPWTSSRYRRDAVDCMYKFENEGLRTAGDTITYILRRLFCC